MNQSPLISPVGFLRMHAPGTMMYQVVVTDPDLPANNLTYSLEGNPTNVSINASTGLIQIEAGKNDGGAIWVSRLRVADSGAPVENLFGIQVFSAIVESMTHSQGGMNALSWNSYAGATYVVEYCEDLTNPNWLVHDTVVGTGATTSVDIDVSAGPYRVYRVRWNF